MIPALFNSIAPFYDRANRLISFGLNSFWLKKMVRRIREANPARVLDLACGTGVLTAKLAALGPLKVIGLDPSEGMLAQAEKRTAGAGNICYVKGFAEALPFEKESFNTVTVSYGIRNFADRCVAFSQIYRVLEPDGTLFILEFSPDMPSWRNALQRFYIHSVLPVLGWMGTGKKAAYRYLRDSVESFPHASVISEELSGAGFSVISYTRWFPGIAVLFIAKKL